MIEDKIKICHDGPKSRVVLYRRRDGEPNSSSVSSWWRCCKQSFHFLQLHCSQNVSTFHTIFISCTLICMPPAILLTHLHSMCGAFLLYRVTVPL